MTAQPEALDDWLLLARCPGLGPLTAKRLCKRCGDAAAIVHARRSVWREAGLSNAGCEWLLAPDAAQLARDREWLTAPGHGLITCYDPRYPAALRAIPDAPAWLFTLGDTDLLASPGFAIVGSRNPSATGVAHARGFAFELAHAGLVIVSGLADGIDAAAHTGALAADGMTVAVCGNGLDRVYPARNRELARRIGRHGLLLSEFAPGTPPMPGHFPRRNRLIAGLSVGSLVVEAARNSGSLITARLALEYGREVFALPGSVHNPLARGCHRLIREGAKLVETTADILEEIAPILPDAPATPAAQSEPIDPAASPDPEYRDLLDCLGHAPARVDELVERSGLTPEAVSSMLLILELQGLIVQTPGGAFTRKN